MMTDTANRTGRPISRRRFVQGSTTLAGVAASGLAFSRTARSEERVLNWVTYPGHGAKEVVGPFEEEHGVKIRAKEYSGGEKLLALVHGSPTGTFDVATTDAPYLEELMDAGFVEPMDPSAYPIEDFWPDFQKWSQHWFDGKLYSVMSSWGYNALAYNAEKLAADDVSSYDVMWHPELKGKVGMRQWYLPVMGCVSLAMGHKKPYDLSAAQFAGLKDKLFSLKPQVAGFWGFGGTFDSLANGGAYVIPGCGDWITGLLQRDGHPIKSAVPQEGSIMWTESVSILAGTDKRELAQAFIRYLTSPEGQIRLMTKSSYMASGPNKKAWEQLNKERPEEAEMLHMTLGAEDNLMALLRAGQIVPRRLPSQQSISDWQDVYTQFQNL